MIQWKGAGAAPPAILEIFDESEQSAHADSKEHDRLEGRRRYGRYVGVWLGKFDGGYAEA
jgi:hypothetical protein